jgi:putative iron-regulated protein
LSHETAGQRPYTDYTTAPNADRRAMYLRVALDQLVRDLESVARDWEPNEPNNYRWRFVAAAPEESLAKILTGIGVLSAAEMSGMRIYTPYDNYDQEDEHACFSDTTHNVLINNLTGIANVYTGRYVRADGTTVSGAGVGTLVEAADPELHRAILEMLVEADGMLRGIYVPFDQAIMQPETRPQVLDTVWVLMDLGDLLVEAGYALGVEFVHTEQMLSWY